MIVNATYHAVFNDGKTVTATCKFDTETKAVFDIEQSEEEAQAQTHEFVTISVDGLNEQNAFDASDGVIFDTGVRKC